MSIIAKQTLISDVQEWLSDKLTVKDVEIVVRALTENLGSYEVSRENDDGKQKEFDDMIEMFCNSKAVEGMSKTSLAQYRYKLKRFRNYDKTPIRQLTVFNFREFLAHEKNRGLADSTLVSYRDTFHAVFGWLYREGLLPKDPCSNLSPIKKKKEVRMPFSNVEVEQIKSACEDERDRAMVWFLLATGCRIGEVIGLNRNDIDFNNLKVKVLGKGNKERYVFMDHVTAMYLQQYLDSRKDGSEALICGQRGGGRLGKGGFEQRLHYLGYKVGIADVYPHRFRHTFAQNMIERGMPIHVLQKLMGHEKVDTTEKYFVMSDSQIQDAYRAYA